MEALIPTITSTPLCGTTGLVFTYESSSSCRGGSGTGGGGCGSRGRVEIRGDAQATHHRARTAHLFNYPWYGVFTKAYSYQCRADVFIYTKGKGGSGGGAHLTQIRKSWPKVIVFRTRRTCASCFDWGGKSTEQSDDFSNDEQITILQNTFIINLHSST